MGNQRITGSLTEVVRTREDMIIKTIFHTYRDDFPLLSDGRLPPSFNLNNCDDLITDLILNLSDLTSLPCFAYIARHTDDKISQEYLAPFLTKFRDFVDCLGKDQQYNIPTVWFVGHFENREIVVEVKRRLDEKNVKHFEEGGEYESFEAINKIYWDNTRDAYLFPKFLHQVTMIGIDLLSTPAYQGKLKQLKCLEWLQYKNAERIQSDLEKMERYLTEDSQYYRKYIGTKVSEYNEFWENFKKVKTTDMGDGKRLFGSWPHFLFNICGVSSRPRICD